MSNPNIYPSNHQELSNALLGFSDALDQTFPELSARALACRPQTSQHVEYDDIAGSKVPLSIEDSMGHLRNAVAQQGFRSTHLTFPLDNQLLCITQSHQFENSYTVHAYTGNATSAPNARKGQVNEAETQRLFTIRPHIVRAVGISLSILTPVVHEQDPDRTRKPYLFCGVVSQFDIFSLKEPAAPSVQADALSPEAQRILEQYGPFGVVAHEIGQDITLLQTIAKNYC